NFPEGRTIADLSDNWKVSFDASKRGPKNPVEFKTLSDWTLSTNDSVKYFSGTAIYKKSFNLNEIQKDKKVMLNLGLLTSMAKVKLNGKELGGVWTAPWTLDVTSALKVGNNELEISVVNNWMNRLIGDLKIPVNERPTWTPVFPYKADSPLQASGLFGPVSIQQAD
ncbi:MAG: glycosylhydrolase-like jelly roll fold domain-containing protein, partial [Paludibacter sp.]